jgi:hypothetical protein
MDFKEKRLPAEIKNIGVDSRYRDTIKYPSVSQYVYDFDNVFQNVVSVNLVFATYEKTGTDLYVNLHIDELSPNLIANANHISGSFCQLPMTHQLNVYNTSMYKCIKTFEKPLAKLSKLTISFLGSDGKLYMMRDHFLRFEIMCLKFSGKEWTHNELFSQVVSVLQLATPKVRSSNVAVSIKVPENYTMEMLKSAFKSATTTLRSYNLSSSDHKSKYNELTTEFKLLAAKIT